MKSKIKTIIVTGAAGLIGSALTRKLLTKNIDVIGYDNFSSGGWEGNGNNLIWEKTDISSPSLEDSLNRYDADVIVHCAAHPGGKSLNEPTLDVEVNLLGSMRLFEWCARSKIPVIYLSSSVVYADQPPGPILENTIVKPGTVYGVSKVACENFLKILGYGYGLEWTALRLFATYGAGHKPSKTQGIVNIMLTQLLEGDHIIVKGSLQRSRDMLYVDDAVDAIIKSIFSNKARGEIINAGTGDPVTIDFLIRCLCDVLGKNYNDLIIQEEEGTIGDPFYNSADCTKAKEILGFAPKYSLTQGLEKLVKKRLG